MTGAGHMTMANPSHHPLLPPTKAPRWIPGLPGTTDVTGWPAGPGRGPQTARNFPAGIPSAPCHRAPPPNSITVSPASPSSGVSELMLAHTKSVYVWLWHALLYLLPCICLLISISVSMWQIFLPEDAWFCWNKIN